MEIIYDVVLNVLAVTETGMHASGRQDEDQLAMVLSCYSDNGKYQYYDITCLFSSIINVMHG